MLKSSVKEVFLVKEQKTKKDKNEVLKTFREQSICGRCRFSVLQIARVGADARSADVVAYCTKVGCPVEPALPTSSHANRRLLRARDIAFCEGFEQRSDLP